MKCRHTGGEADCLPVCLLVYGDMFFSAESEKTEESEDST